MAAHALTPRLVRRDDPEYPARLREIARPPPELHAWGDLSLLARPAVAIVGSRDHTRYGAEVTRTFAQAAARRGIVVVSGMARGLDAVAHVAALDAGGGSIGVLGCGYGVIYPKRNAWLYARMAAEGCLVTEYRAGEPPFKGSFPRRNRIIAGMCRVTLVVEAAMTSGAINTADEALRQGRDVLAVPGPVTSPVSVGTNRLISFGAKPALVVSDLLEEFGFPREEPENRAGPLVPARVPPGSLTPVQQVLWSALVERPRHVDQLVAAAGAPAADVLTELTRLELEGVVVQRAGMVYELVGG